MLSTTGSARLSRSAFQSGPIQAGSNLMCVCVWEGGGTPKDPTCSHTICCGTIPLLSLLLAPFTRRSAAPDQSATASRAASLGTADRLLDFPRCSSHTRPPTTTTTIVLTPRCLSSIFSRRLSFPTSPSLSFTLIHSLLGVVSAPPLYPTVLACSPALPFPLPRSQLSLWTTESLI